MSLGRQGSRGRAGLKILGVMTGTSCDGLDAACVEFTRDGQARTRWAFSAPYPTELKRRVLAVQKPGATTDVRSLALLNRDLGAWYARVLASSVKSRAVRPDVVANHGQTILHRPEEEITLQSGDAARIAASLGVSVVSGFRYGDMAAGGKGAPLVPRFHLELARELQGLKNPVGIAVHNLGGISNVSYFGPRGKVIAFDTGPCNSWIDFAAGRASLGRLKMDRGGQLASSGRADPKAIQKLLKHPYFRQSPPKAAGRDQFPPEMLLKLTRAKGADLVATATAAAAAAIAESYSRWILRARLPLREVWVCGGGALNPSLIRELQRRLKPADVQSIARGGVYDPTLIEAEAFARFGLLALLGQPLGGPWTGARQNAPSAQITPGANWARVQTLVRSLL